MTLQAQSILQLARETLDIESAALQDLKSRLDERFVKAVDMMLNVKGRVVVTGMGKSGHIGRKIAATLASTGTPAMFVHPAEASHGDLGMIKLVDVVLGISNSGESDELVAILPVLKRQGVPLIAMTGGLQSSLARHADVVLDSSVEKEACPLNLAPTASTPSAAVRAAACTASAVTASACAAISEKESSRSRKNTCEARASARADGASAPINICAPTTAFARCISFAVGPCSASSPRIAVARSATSPAFTAPQPA